MRRAYWSLISLSLIIATVATGCARATPAVATAAPPTTSAQSQAPAGAVSASVKVQPEQKSNLAFLISAPIEQINVKEGDQVKAGQALIVLDTPDLTSAVAAAQGELKSALANQSVQREGRQTRIQRGHRLIWLGSMPEIRQQADARVLQAQASLEAAQADLAQGTLVAPFDGTVASISVNAGETAKADQTVLVLGNLSHLQIVTTDLSEREISTVRVGQSATTRLKAFEQELPGTVTAISPLSGVNNGDTVFQVTIELDQQPKDLLWGMTGDVQINTQ